MSRSSSQARNSEAPASSSALADELKNVIGLVPLISPNGSVRQQELASFTAVHPVGDVVGEEVDRRLGVLDLAGPLKIVPGYLKRLLQQER
jgi:hypothetical protein